MVILIGLLTFLSFITLLLAIGRKRKIEELEYFLGLEIIDLERKLYLKEEHINSLRCKLRRRDRRIKNMILKNNKKKIWLEKKKK